MANDPLDLWPEWLQVDPLTPEKILKLQAQRLRDHTRGWLTAEVVTTKATEPSAEANGNPEETVHRFEIVAPRLGNYRYQLFVCRHNTDLVFPVWVIKPNAHDLKEEESEATTQDEFILIVRKLLNSRHSRSLVNSLLARIADADAPATVT